MTTFEKYKEYLKNLINTYQASIADAEVQRSRVNEIIKNWDKVEIVEDPKTLTIQARFIRACLPRYYKKLHEIAVYHDFNTLTSKIDNLKEKIVILKKYISAFDKEKAIYVINNFSLLLATLQKAEQEGYISIEQATKIFGSVANFNTRHTHKCAYNDSIKPVVAKIASIFNATGEFAKVDESIDLGSLIRTIADWERTYNKNQLFADETSERIINPFIDSLANTYAVFVDSYVVSKPAKRVIREIDYTYLRELRKYYKNGEIINIPPDLVAFGKLLDNCQVGEQEKSYIVSQINKKYQEQKSMRRNKVLDSKPVPSIPVPNNIIFLLDDHNNSYFENDLKQTDRSNWKYAISLLNKIINDNRATFNMVRLNGMTTGLYQVYNSVYQIIFKEVGPGIYLILGLNERQYKKDNEFIIERNISNSDYINELMILLLDSESKSKLLAEHAKLIPTLEDNKLTRKSPETD